MSDVLDWSPPWSKPVGELAPMRANGNLPWLTGAARARVLGLEPLNSCIARPPAFPGLELAVPHDAVAGIETLVEDALGGTVAGIERTQGGARCDGCRMRKR